MSKLAATGHAIGHSKPRGKAPVGCYWDPQPHADAGAWRVISTGVVYNPKEAEAQRNAARRHEGGARSRKAKQLVGESMSSESIGTALEQLTPRRFHVSRLH